MQQLKKEFERGDIDKKSYIDQRIEEYNRLFEYQELMQGSNVKKILIDRNEMVFSIEVKLKEKPITIQMYAKKNDRSAPTFLELIGYKYEKSELSVLCEVMDILSGERKEEERGVFFDVGANMGWYSIILAHLYGEMKYYLFEPASEIHSLCKKNMGINQISNYELYNFGFSNENGEADLYYSATASGATSLKPSEGYEVSDIERCVMRRLDDFVQENRIENIDVIKCDVEGSERLVFEGGLSSIKKYKPVIFSEMLRKWSAKFDYHPNDIIELLSKQGYDCFTIYENGRVVENDLNERDRILKRIEAVDENTVETNYFFFHRDKHSHFIQKLCV